MKVAVIGGGPSGLVTLKYLVRAHLNLDCEPIEARLFELEDSVGGAFAHRTYEDAELVSSKQLTTFSDFRCRVDRDFLSASDYVQYLRDYCSYFRLWPSIELGAKVRSVRAHSSQGYVIEYDKKSSELFRWRCDAVARNPGPILLPILGRKPNPNEPGIPIDVSRANLFDTTYVHQALRNSMILWEYYNYYIKALLWVCSGTTSGMDQWVGEISQARHHPSKSPSLWLYALRSAFVQTPIPDTHGRQVDLAPLPKRINESGVVEFVDNGRPEYDRLKFRTIQPDVIVLCTGYQQTFPFLDNTHKTSTHHLSSYVRGIWRRDEPAMGFIGFVRPSLGAIPPLAEMQAQLLIGPWAWEGAMEVLVSEELWHTITRRPVLFGETLNSSVLVQG
uniref:Uncharacterized protein n=1 Tax=Fusarium oxysporum (strain Fo5176) TaxID=660025 RepID=A0A0D2Y802_FUSOF